MLLFIPQLGARSNHKSRMDTIGGITREDIGSCVDIVDNVIPAQYGEGSKYILIHRAEANQIMIAAEKAVKNNHRKKYHLTLAAEAINAQLLLNDNRYALLPKGVYDIAFSTAKSRKVENDMEMLNTRILCHTPALLFYKR